MVMVSVKYNYTYFVTYSIIIVIIVTCDVESVIAVLIIVVFIIINGSFPFSTWRCWLSNIITFAGRRISQKIVIIIQKTWKSILLYNLRLINKTDFIVN